MVTVKMLLSHGLFPSHPKLLSLAQVIKTLLTSPSVSQCCGVQACAALSWSVSWVPWACLTSGRVSTGCAQSASLLHGGVGVGVWGMGGGAYLTLLLTSWTFAIVHTLGLKWPGASHSPGITCFTDLSLGQRSPLCPASISQGQYRRN